MWFQVELYLPMRAMYILINRGKQGATMSHKKKVSIPCSHNVSAENLKDQFTECLLKLWLLFPQDAFM